MRMCSPRLVPYRIAPMSSSVVATPPAWEPARRASVARGARGSTGARRRTRGASDDVPVLQDVLEVRVADLVEFVADLDDRFVRRQDAPQVDRRAAHDDIARDRVDRRVELLDLFCPVIHRWHELRRRRALPALLLHS